MPAFSKKLIFPAAHRLLWLATFFLLGVIILLGAAALYQQHYANTFFPGARLAGYNIAGLTYAEAKTALTGRIEEFSRRGITVSYKDTAAVITAAATLAESPDSAFDLFRFDMDASLNQLWQRGHGGNVARNLAEQIYDAVLAPDRPLRYILNEDKLSALLRSYFSGFESPAQNAAIVMKNDGLSVEPETLGKIFDYPSVMAAIKKQLAYLHTQPITLTLHTDYPTAYAADIEPVLEPAGGILRQAPLTLAIPANSARNANAQVSLPATELAPLLTAVRDAEAKRFSVGLKTDETDAYLIGVVATLTDIAPVDAKFSIQNGKVIEFVASRSGQQLDVTATRERLQALLGELLTNQAATTTITVVVNETLSAITNETVNDLGIAEVIGIGQSNFAGSPANRRHNIRVGAAAVNGTLIAPGQEFSLLKTLGAINGSTGYLPELVIKGNRTVPEYGGGLCQIGTTVFRGTIESGLPVTARQNHSYRVSYYEPAGTDATIYDPAPDYRFVNDTRHHVLIQSRIEGDDLYFEFWGTRDGRAITKTKPVIYNITAPPPTHIIETTDLAPGVRRCTERAHNGADAYFDYTVAYNDGAVKQERFQSHYRPWQEVCLVGVEQTASTTPETLP